MAWLDVDGVRLEVRGWGREHDLCGMVFLHEGLGSVHAWRDVPGQLAELTGFSAVAYSREGYGNSERLRKPFAADFMHREAERLGEVIRALQVQVPVLVGHSDGATIALIAAAQGLPVSGIVALAPHVFVEAETVAAIADARRRFDEGDLRARLEKQHGPNTETMFRAWSDVWLSPEFASFDVGDLLPRISCPVLAIMGDADPYGTYRQLDVLEARCGGPVQQMRIAGARHAPHRQRPEIVIPAMAAFVRRLLA